MGDVPDNLRRPDVTRRVREYLREHAETGQPIYLKSKHVAESIDGATTKMVANAFRSIRDDDSAVIVSRWSGEVTTPVVWEVRLDAE